MSHCSLLLPGGFYFGGFFGSLPWTLFTGVETVLGRVPSSSSSPVLQFYEAGSGPGGRQKQLDGQWWVPCHAGCVMLCRGCRGSFAAAPELHYCPFPSHMPHKSPPQPIPTVRPGYISLLSNQQLLLRPGSSALVP